MAYNKSLLKVAIIFLYLISILSTAYILFIVIKGNFIYFYKDIVLCFIAMIVSQLVATQIGIKKLIFRKPNHIMSASRIMALIQYCLLLCGMLLRNLSRLDYATMKSDPNFNLQLFATIGNLLNMGRWANIVENIGIFTLFGFFLLLAFPICKKSIVYFAICILFSILIEVLQYAFCVGIFDVDDLVMYFIGSCFGWLMLKTGKWIKQTLRCPTACM